VLQSFIPRQLREEKFLSEIKNIGATYLSINIILISIHGPCEKVWDRSMALCCIYTDSVVSRFFRHLAAENVVDIRKVNDDQNERYAPPHQPNNHSIMTGRAVINR